jgi:tRNA uridine 5-carbamoylmethylation protein Kti12
MTLKVINLLGGPGIGKSTLRAKLFSLMKEHEIDVEEVTEYAKDKTWEHNSSALSDQLYVLANQNRRLTRLKDQVEWVVSDSPIILCAHYASIDYLPINYKNLIFEIWDTYDNYNFVIERTVPYKTSGRYQTEDEAKSIDRDIVDMLIKRNIPFTTIRQDENPAQIIFNTLFTMNDKV